MARWHALAGHNDFDHVEALGRYRFRDGTVALIDEIAADGKAHVRLGEAVACVQQDGARVTVTSRSGAQYTGRAARLRLERGRVRARHLVHAAPRTVLAEPRPAATAGGTRVFRQRRLGQRLARKHRRSDRTGPHGGTTRVAGLNDTREPEPACRSSMDWE
jgi:uncharacterized Zn-binding protein involved in type VI secretion